MLYDEIAVGKSSTYRAYGNANERGRVSLVAFIAATLLGGLATLF